METINRDICRQCYLKHKHHRQTKDRDVIVAFVDDWNYGWIVCRPRLKDGHYGSVKTKEAAPCDCPYQLEHTMSEETGPC